MRSGVDLQHVDPQVRPQDDLFTHLNGKWLATAEIPADRSADGVFHALRDAAEADVRAIIERATATAERGSVAEKVGILYASFMDEAGVEARQREPIASDLEGIRGVRSVTGLIDLLARLQLQGSVPGFLMPFVNTDAQDSSQYIVYLEQGGLGLPDETYYHLAEFAEVRADYERQVARMLMLGGWTHLDQQAAEAAARVMELESAIAGHHWSNVECRDAVRTYNRRRIEELPAFSPDRGAREWLFAMSAPDEHLAEVVVRQPDFVAALPKLLADFPVEHWREWLAWHLIRRAAPLLDSEIVQANFEFYGTRLSGVPQLRERWKRGVALVEGAIGEAVGELYVAEHFPPEAKRRMLDLVENVVAAFATRLEVLPWMGTQTRERALAKLDSFTPKIGYPDQWRDYGPLTVAADDLVGNVRRAALFEARREWGKLGGPVDRLEWFMTPQTVNAYYNPGMNEIVFPAAILQPPFFDPEADDAVNYGAIGAIIGHEIGHGFDDQGSKYDGAGNLVDWWTPEDRERFDALAQQLIEQFSAMSPHEIPDHQVNGALTVGENIGDLGGIAVALEAYRISLEGGEAPILDGFSGAQRFFMGWAQAWRTKVRREEAIRLLTIDPHSPPELRCNIVTNLAEFHEAFAVIPGDGMWREPQHRVTIW